MGLADAIKPSRRRVVNLRLRPALQLRLPLAVLILTFTFAAIFAFHTHQAYGRFLELAFADASLQSLVDEQLRDYLVVSASFGIAYVFTVLVACLASANRWLGPIVPIRRQLEAMKNGDYSARVALRHGDAYVEVAQDLNEVAQILEREKAKSSEPSLSGFVHR